MILGLRLPAAESDPWVWARRLLFVVAGTAVAWFLLLMVSGQAHAAPPPVLPCVASSAQGASLGAPVDEDSVDVPPAPGDCASQPLNAEQPAPAAVAVEASAGRAGTAGPPIDVDDVLPPPALDQQTRRNSAGPACTTGGIGTSGHAVVAGPGAAANAAGPGSGGCAGTSGCPGGGDPARAEVLKAPMGQSVALSRPTAHHSYVPATHGQRADSVVVPQPGGQSGPAAGWVQTSGSAAVITPVTASVRPSTGPESPGDAELPPPPLPAAPGPSAGASTTSASGSGGHDRFDALSTLGGRQHRILPAASSGVPSGSDGNVIRAQGRPEPRPD